MKILLVEDDEDKREQLTAFFKNELNGTVIEARSMQSGIKILINQSFDLIVLDMSMTTFDVTPTEKGGRPQPFGGREILYQMKRRKIGTKVIVVTQYDLFGKDDEETTLEELDKQLYTLFPNNYLGAIPYSVKFSGWQQSLLKTLSKNKLIM
jgi:DNA-binding response OmpR family regulator